MKKIFFSLCLALLVVGCASTPPIFSTRLQDIEHRDYYSQRETFKADETAAVVVSGQAGHDVTVQLRKPDLDNLLVQKKTFYIKSGELKWVYWKALPPGPYLAELIVRDETNAVANFVIEPEETD
jgi:hypothetical protein